MDYTYKIENYSQYNNGIFVVYTSADPSKEPLGQWITVTNTMSEPDIIDAINRGAPIEKWSMAKNVIAEDLVGVIKQKENFPSEQPEYIPQPSPEAQLSDDEQMSFKVKSLWESADKYVAEYISGVAIGILTIGVVKKMPKALNVLSWSKAIWSEYYIRKAQITPTSTLDLDFSSFGPIPHTVPELQQEIGI